MSEIFPIGIEVGVCHSLNELPIHFHSLFESGEKKSFFYSKTWFENYARNILQQGQNDILIYYAESKNGKPIMILPLYIENGAIGKKEMLSQSNYYSSLFSPIYNDIADFKIVFEKILEKIKQLNIDLLVLKPLDKDDLSFNLMLSSLQNQQFLCETYFCFGNWYLELNGDSFEKYFKKLPSKLINTINRKYKKLQQLNYNIIIYTDEFDIKNKYKDFKMVYDKSWKRNEPFPDFIENLVRSFSIQGKVRLGFIYIDNIPVAAQIWIVMGNTASIYKLAYAPEYKSLSVGTLLTTELIKYVITRDNISIIDYLTGDDSYKQDWMNRRRERWGIIAYNKKTFFGWITGKKYQISKLIKRIGKLGV